MTGTRTIDVLRRFWWLVAIFAIAGAVAGGLPEPEKATDSITRWTASHTILVSSPSDSSRSGTPTHSSSIRSRCSPPPARFRSALPRRSASRANRRVLLPGISVAADQQTGAIRISTTQDTR